MQDCSVLIVGGGDVSRRGDNFPEHTLKLATECPRQTDPKQLQQTSN